jgi:hypothetical protein
LPVLAFGLNFLFLGRRGSPRIYVREDQLAAHTLVLA